MRISDFVIRNIQPQVTIRLKPMCNSVKITVSLTIPRPLERFKPVLLSVLHSNYLLFTK
jgi:hypothetical protein